MIIRYNVTLFSPKSVPKAVPNRVNSLNKLNKFNRLTACNRNKNGRNYHFLIISTVLAGVAGFEPTNDGVRGYL